MTAKQRRRLICDLWPAACRAAGWDVRDESLRHELYAQVLGAPKRFRDFTERDFSAVKARLELMSGKMSGALEDGRPEINLRRQLLWVIEHQQIPAIEATGRNARAYIASIVRDRFKLAGGTGTYRDISARRLDPREPSELEQLVRLLAARIADMR